MSNLLKKKMLFSILVAAFILVWSAVVFGSEIKVSYAYKLSNFSGTMPFSWPSLFLDRENDEIYVFDRGERSFSIFNKRGMEVHSFGDDERLPRNIVDGTVDSGGNILLLPRSSSRGDKVTIIRCNYRGDYLSKFEISDLPVQFSDFQPDRLVSRGGRLYLVDTIQMKIVVTDGHGHFEDGYDVNSLLEEFPKDSKDYDPRKDIRKKADTGIYGFSVDKDGNMLFTIPGLFSAYVLSSDKRMRGFGRSGSGPGRFGIVSGIASDDRGYFYVTDRLRCVVLVFGPDLQFKAEFGYRGSHQGALIAPSDLVIDGEGKVFVAQMGARSISVFKTSNN